MTDPYRNEPERTVLFRSDDTMRVERAKLLGRKSGFVEVTLRLKTSDAWGLANALQDNWAVIEVVRGSK